jgi:hypothetical protein
MRAAFKVTRFSCFLSFARRLQWFLIRTVGGDAEKIFGVGVDLLKTDTDSDTDPDPDGFKGVAGQAAQRKGSA